MEEEELVDLHSLEFQFIDVESRQEKVDRIAEGKARLRGQFIVVSEAEGAAGVAAVIQLGHREPVALEPFLNVGLLIGAGVVEGEVITLALHHFRDMDAHR